jgi:hypothetical protein
MDAAALALAALVWHGSAEIASGPAERGPWQMNESRYDYLDDPTVATDERGAVAWVDQSRKDVLFQRFSPAGEKLGQPVNVSRSPAIFSWLPRSDDGGQTFSQPMNLSNSRAGDGKGRIDKDRWQTAASTSPSAATARCSSASASP